MKNQIFKKEDMIDPSIYSWSATPGDDPDYRGKIDAIKFNRKEGYEVLPLINEILKKLGTTEIGTGKRIENLIKDMPRNIFMRNRVIDYLLKILIPGYKND